MEGIEIKDGLKCATDDMVEIEAALKTACISHELTLAQVSITYEDSNDMPYSSSLEGKHMKQMIAHKMIVRCPDSDDYDFKDYCGTCDMLPSKIGEGLVGKAIENYKPHFCRNIYEMNNNELPALIDTVTIKKHSCLVICLKSTRKDVVYVLEFLWLQNRKYTVLIESLVLTLKRCLPNFKFAFGGELGGELFVVKVGNSSKVESGDFKIFKGVILSPIPKMLEKERVYVAEQCIAPPQAKGNTRRQLTKEAIEQQYGMLQKEAAEILQVSLSKLNHRRKELGLGDWEGPNGVKRKANRSYKDQSDMINEEDNRELLGPVPVNGATLTIKAYYEGSPIKLHLPLL